LFGQEAFNIHKFNGTKFLMNTFGPWPEVASGPKWPNGQKVARQS